MLRCRLYPRSVSDMFWCCTGGVGRAREATGQYLDSASAATTLTLTPSWLALARQRRLSPRQRVSYVLGGVDRASGGCWSINPDFLLQASQRYLPKYEGWAATRCRWGFLPRER